MISSQEVVILDFLISLFELGQNFDLLYELMN